MLNNYLSHGSNFEASISSWARHVHRRDVAKLVNFRHARNAGHGAWHDRLVRWNSHCNFLMLQWKFKRLKFFMSIGKLCDISLELRWLRLVSICIEEGCLYRIK
jgi:hypothetical protein